MGESARQIAGTIKQYPLVYGLTCDGGVINAYAARANELRTSLSAEMGYIQRESATSPVRLRSQGSVGSKPASEKRSLFTQGKFEAEESARNYNAPRSLRTKSTSSKSSRSEASKSTSVGKISSKSSGGVAPSKSSSASKTTSASSGSPTKTASSPKINPVSYFHLWTLNMNDPTHNVLLAGYLAKIHVTRYVSSCSCDSILTLCFRLEQFNAWRQTVGNLSWRKPGKGSQQVPSAEELNNTNEKHEDASSKSSSSSSEDDSNNPRPSGQAVEDQALERLKATFAGVGFTPISKKNLSVSPYQSFCIFG